MCEVVGPERMTEETMVYELRDKIDEYLRSECALNWVLNLTCVSYAHLKNASFQPTGFT